MSNLAREQLLGSDFPNAEEKKIDGSDEEEDEVVRKMKEISGQLDQLNDLAGESIEIGNSTKNNLEEQKKTLKGIEDNLKQTDRKLNSAGKNVKFLQRKWYDPRSFFKKRF